MKFISPLSLLLRAIALCFIAGALLVPASVFAREPTLTVSGALTYREPFALPQNATVRVRIEDVSLADAPSRTISEIEPRVRAVPVPFTLNVPRDGLEDGRRYGLRGMILGDDGELLWTTDTFVPVDPTAEQVNAGSLVMTRTSAGDRPKQQVFLCGETAILAFIDGEELMLTRPSGTDRLAREQTASGARFASSDGMLSLWLKGNGAQFVVDGAERACAVAEPSAFLADREWMVEDIDGGGVVDMSRSSMTFGPEGRLYGFAGCNDYTGEWTAEGATLETSRIAQTRKACLLALAHQEAAMLDILGHAAKYGFTRTGAVVISDTNGRSITARQW
ncbi:META domain-containing protein [Epibacterium sp. DP7N7-1]|nr:META domain-containing protein [Epibacterium sp. DP7N7-1]